MRLWGRAPLATLSNYFAPEVVLGDENRVRTAMRFAEMKPIRTQNRHQSARKAAVLIPLCVVDAKVSLLYTLRAPHLRSHRGQVSFPGGQVDDDDPDLEHTALRETQEELGLPKDHIQLWGSGRFIATRGDFCVLPVIGQIMPPLQLKRLKVNQREVEEVFTVPLEDLCHPSYLGHTQFRGSYSAPVFLAAPRRIWGLTAFITYVFLQALLSPKAYTHKLNYIPSVLPLSKP